mgnify:CR=1
YVFSNGSALDVSGGKTGKLFLFAGVMLQKRLQPVICIAFLLPKSQNKKNGGDR